MMIVWPMTFDKPCEIARTMTSSPSPGAPAVISVIGFAGHVCAIAAEQHSAAVASTISFLILT
jgi:hypothetical protein